MTEYRVRGEVVVDTGSRLPWPHGTAPVRHEVWVAPAARGDAPTALVEAEGSDVVEVELDNGIVFWTSVEQLREDAAGVDPSADADALPSRYPDARPSERGLVGIAIKVLRILKVDVPAGAALAAAAHIESKLSGPPGLYRLGRDGALAAERIEAGTLPVLLLLHGTASSTGVAFAGLTTGADSAIAWKGLYERYAGRVFGFEHRTLTESPLTNAIELLEALPASGMPPLHLVSHSRGGLLGDLLAHGGLAEAFPGDLLDAAGVTDAERPPLARLNRLLAERAPRVERFVRVACPAAGTTLASGRLDIYLSLLIHALSAVPTAGPLLGALGELVAAVAKERTKPDVLPGLAAQMPKAPLIRLLNSSQQTLESDLTVIAGDSDGLLKNLANLFYWHANDLVVDTRSMFRGAPRVRRRWYRAEGREVHHLNYFMRAETVGRLVDGLTRAEGDDAGFSTLRPRGAERGVEGAVERGVERGHVEPGLPGANLDQPAVVLLPGIMGSHLSVRHGEERNRVWLDFSDLLKGRMAQLAVPDGPGIAVTPDGVLKRAYAAFATYLRGNGQHVLAVDYDWRLSLDTAVDRLAGTLVQRLDASAQPVVLVAHSMGGLVARLLIQRKPQVWKRIVDRGGRLVQLGTPNGGSYLIPYLLRGEEPLLRRLAVLDAHHDLDFMTALIARFPGLLEMSPRTAADPDFFKDKTWETFGVVAPPAPASMPRPSSPRPWARSSSRSIRWPTSPAAPTRRPPWRRAARASISRAAATAA